MDDVTAATTTLHARATSGGGAAPSLLRRAGAAPRAPSFAETAERHLDDVYRYLLVFTRDASVAEDLAAETFERALRVWRRFDPARSSARTWLCTIARTTALDHFRSEQRRHRRGRAGAEPEGDVEKPDLRPSPAAQR